MCFLNCSMEESLWTLSDISSNRREEIQEEL